MLINATLTVPGDKDTTLQYAANHFVTIARDAIEDHGFFSVALSGGSTPKAIYELICQPGLSEEMEWEKVHLFWSDERSVFPDDPESNYRMAMEAGFANMPLLPQHIHRMIAEKDIEAEAHRYETEMKRILDDQALDLVMLGMGEDGHTASLFPGTAALEAHGRLCVANHIPQKKTWRMTLTLECINAAAHIVVYVIGSNKKEMLHHVFNTPPKLPCQHVGTVDNPATWIADEAASQTPT